jgi:hypothetical protein
LEPERLDEFIETIENYQNDRLKISTELTEPASLLDDSN